YMLNPSNATITTLLIPATSCISCHVCDAKQRIDRCVALIRTWLHAGDGYIPYVWGGSSFTIYQTGAYHMHTAPSSASDTRTWYVIDYETNTIKNGFDCSG